MIVSERESERAEKERDRDRDREKEIETEKETEKKRKSLREKGTNPKNRDEKRRCTAHDAISWF